MRKKWHKFLAALALGLLLLPYSVFAFTQMAEEELVISGEVNDDLYAAAGQLTVDSSAKVNGDLIAAGGEVVVEGEVQGDVTVAGGTVKLLGSIGDDLRVAGGEVRIAAGVSDDLVVFAGDVEIAPEAVINGDVVVSGGRVDIGGEVRGNVRVNAGEVMLNGIVAGSIEIETGRLQMADNALVEGNLTYTAPQEAEFDPNLVVGEVKYQEVQRGEYRGGPEAARHAWSKIKLWGTMFALVANLLLGVLIVLAAPNLLYKTGEKVKEKPLLSFLLGIAVIAGMALLSFLGFVTLVGWKVGLIVLLKLVAVMVALKVFAGYTVAHLVLKAKKKATKAERFGLMALGVAALAVIFWVPVLGPTVCIIVNLVTLGGLILTGKDLWEVVTKKELI